MGSIRLVNFSSVIKIDFEVENNFLNFLKFIFREKGREGEREEKKHPLVASCMHPNQGLSLQPRHVP